KWVEIPLIGASGLLARLPVTILPPEGTGLPALEPRGVPFFDLIPGGLSFSFFAMAPSLISPAEPAPLSASLPDPEPPPRPFLARFLLVDKTWLAFEGSTGIVIVEDFR